MGSISFTEACSERTLSEASGYNLTPDDAYLFLVDSARREYGENSYNGSIATTSGWQYHDDDPTPRTVAEANAIIEDAIEDYGKWGPVGCIRVTNIRDRGPGWLFFGWAAI